MPIRPDLKSRYPKDWKRRSYFVRFVRAGGRCEWCGAEHGKPHLATGSIVVLTTAHVNDRRPEASSLLNLAALCQLCHNRHDARERVANRRARILRESGQMGLFDDQLPSMTQDSYDFNEDLGNRVNIFTGRYGVCSSKPGQDNTKSDGLKCQGQQSPGHSQSR